MSSSLSVFVCGTYSDLSAERGAVLDALQRLEVEHHSMELFGARPRRPIQTCLDEVRRSRIVVVIVGHQYGTLVPGLDISFSEAEYQEAFRLNLECLVYFSAASEHSDEEDAQKALLLQQWKTTLSDRHTPAYFPDANKLALQVAIDVGRTIRDLEDRDNSSDRVHGTRPLFPRHEDRQAGPRVTSLYCQRFGDESRQLVHGLATDSDGNAIIVGDFWGSIDFGRSKLTSAGDRDIFLAKFNRSGICLWSRRFGDQFEQVGVGLDTDANGSIFIASSFNGSLDFGGAALVSRGRYNVALAKLDKHGRHLWSKSFGDSQYHVAECIAVAPAGWVAVAGRFQGSLDFGGGELKSESSQTDMFLAAFSADGAPIWAKRIGGEYEQQTRSISIDADGNIGLVGVFKGSISFGGLSLAEESSTDYCGFLAKFDRLGNVLWCKRFGDPSVEQGSVVSFDRANGDILTAGFMRNKLPRETSIDSSSVCLFARYDPSGVLRWSRAFGTQASATSLSVAADGRILLTGCFQGTIDLGLGPLISAGGYDVFAAMFNADGSTRWARRYGDERHQFLINGAHGHDSSIVLAGSFHGTVDFGSGALVASGYDGKTEGSEDVFLAILQEDFQDGPS
jgi:Domain of unknown function (DUF4062)